MNSRFAKKGTKITHFFLSNCWFLFLCLYANFCKSGVHSYQLYCAQSTSSPILKSLVPWGNLVGGYLRWYSKSQKYQTILSNCPIQLKNYNSLYCNGLVVNTTTCNRLPWRVPWATFLIASFMLLWKMVTETVVLGLLTNLYYRWSSTRTVVNTLYQ